jgi:hypothetical protein
MSNTFKNYTEASVSALKFNPRSQEVIQKKQEILDSVAQYYKAVPNSVLFYGFSPLMLACKSAQLAVTEITEEIKNYLDASGIKYVYIAEEDLVDYRKQFDWVIAGDEYFTFADSEEEQKDKIAILAGMAKKLVLTTLRDYKNQDFKDREFSQPLAVHNNKQAKLFVEYHDNDFTDRNAWNTTLYELDRLDATVYGPFARRSMYFKQMAKFSIDAGAKEFYVHKNLMYKSVIKKNYEHVITITF